MKRLLVALLMLGCSSGVESVVEEKTHVEPAPAEYVADPVLVEVPEVPTINVYVDPALPVEVVDEVTQGVLGWAYSTEGSRGWNFVTEIEDATLVVLTVGEHAGVCTSEDAAGCVREIGGLWDAAPGEMMTLFLIEGHYERATTYVVMHEIGHLLGLTHGEAGLMHGTVPEDPSIDCPDEHSIERLEELTGATLQFCE